MTGEGQDKPVSRALKIIEEGVRLIEEGLPLLRQDIEAAEWQHSSEWDAAELFEVTIDRRRRLMNSDAVETLKPDDFGLFVDLAFQRIGGTAARGGCAAVGLGATGLQRADILLLERLIERQGMVTTASDLSENGYEPKNRRMVARHVCRLRNALGDNAKAPRLIQTAGNTDRVRDEGRGYLVPLEVRCCMIRRARSKRGQQDRGAD